MIHLDKNIFIKTISYSVLYYTITSVKAGSIMNKKHIFLFYSWYSLYGWCIATLGFGILVLKSFILFWIFCCIIIHTIVLYSNELFRVLYTRMYIFIKWKTTVKLKKNFLRIENFESWLKNSLFGKTLLLLYPLIF